VLQLFNVQSKATLKADRKCLRKRLEAGQVGIAAHKDMVMHGADTRYGEVSESLDENIVIIVVVNGPRFGSETQMSHRCIVAYGSLERPGGA
jgi:hypothetical protein